MAPSRPDAGEEPPRGPSVPRSSVVLAVLAVLVLVPATSAAAPASQDLLTAETFQAAGAVEGSSPDGAFTVRSPVSELSLEAEASRVTVDFQVQEGTRSSVNEEGEGRFVTHSTDTRRDRTTFEAAVIHLEPTDRPNGTPQVVGFNASAEAATSAVGATEVTASVPEYLAGYGFRPDTEGTGDGKPLSFWPSASDAWARVAGADRVHVDGDLRLFVNNATVEIANAERSWTNWTGVATEQTGPATESFEKHLLVLTLEDAQVTVAAEDAVDRYSESVRLTTEGVLSADETQGILATPDARYHFEGEPMELQGQAIFDLARQQSDGEPTLGLAVAGVDELAVDGGQRIEPSSEGAAAALPDPGSALPLVAGLLVLGVAAARSSVARDLWAHVQERRYARAMTRGRELANGGDLGTAIDEFTRATGLRPSKGVAWYHLALTQLEHGRAEDALATIEEAREREAVIDELDLLELEAQAAKATGDWDRVGRTMQAVAAESEPMAAALVRDLGVPESVLGPELAGKLMDETDHTDFVGYV